MRYTIRAIDAREQKLPDDGSNAMNHKNFVITSSVLMFLVVGIVAGLAIYSGFGVKASIPDLPEAVSYLPADCKAVFGMNVKRFIASPVYAKFEEKHGQEMGKDLAEFIAKTGVDPRKDISYIVAGARTIESGKGSGVIVAIGQFNTAAIKSYLSTKATPISVKVDDTEVVMVPEADGSKLEKGLAFLKESEIALGDLDSLKALINARKNPALLGIKNNQVLAPILDQLNPKEMFWFAGDAASMLSKAPTNTPLGANLSAIQNVVGTLDLTDAVAGKITVTAKDKESARKLADVAKGFIALGQLASDQNAELSMLLNGISLQHFEETNSITIVVNFPIDVLERLEQAKVNMKKVV
jgi:hypothetical protein